MADDGNGVVGHALDGGVAGTAIDCVGAGLVEPESPAQEIVRCADLVEIVARHGEEARSGVAVLPIEHKFRRHRDDVDAGAFGGFGLIERQYAQHGKLPLAFHSAQVGDGRSLSAH